MAKRTKAEAVASKALMAASLADDGAAIGSLFGPTGAGVGGVLGGITGLIIGDQTTVFPLDMVAIPAYQAYMIQGTPSMQIYIKEGEVLTQVQPTDAEETMAIISNDLKSTKPKRKTSAYHRRYSKHFKALQNRPDYKKKDGTWKKGGFKRAVKAAHMKAKKEMK